MYNQGMKVGLKPASSNKHIDYKDSNIKNRQDFSSLLSSKAEGTLQAKSAGQILPTQTQSLEVPASFANQEKLHWTKDPLKKDDVATSLLQEDKEAGLPLDRKGRIHKIKHKEEKEQEFGYAPPPEFKMPRKMADYSELILKYANKYGLDPNLVAGLIKQESGFNPKARSHCGAMGMMQLMPSTAKAMGVTQPYDPADNIDGGCKYLRQMLDKFDGNTRLALAAYNAGPGNVSKYGNRVPPFAETQNYVRSIASNVKGLLTAGVFKKDTDLA